MHFTLPGELPSSVSYQRDWKDDNEHLEQQSSFCIILVAIESSRIRVYDV